MLAQTLQELKFLKNSKFEVEKSKIIIRDSDRTSRQEELEKYFKTKKILYQQLKKPTELQVEGATQKVVFKPLKAKGKGGLKFEETFTDSLNNWFSGFELDEIKDGDTVKELQKQIKLKQDSRYLAEQVGSRNSKRPPQFSSGKIKLQNNTGMAVSDVDLKVGRQTYYLSLKFTNQFYIYNGSVGSYFSDPRTQKEINEYFGFDGMKMIDFGKEFVVKTKKANLSAVTNNLKDIITQALGPDVILVNKVRPGVNYVSAVRGFNHRVQITNLNEQSYGYPIEGTRKYAFIKFRAHINGHNYEVSFQFRGTTATDRGPKYLRILLKVL